jgi:hypothetical protein
MDEPVTVWQERWARDDGAVPREQRLRLLGDRLIREPEVVEWLGGRRALAAYQHEPDDEPPRAA